MYMSRYIYICIMFSLDVLSCSLAEWKMLSKTSTFNCKPQALNPYTLHPGLSTLNPKPSIPNTKPSPLAP